MYKQDTSEKKKIMYHSEWLLIFSFFLLVSHIHLQTVALLVSCLNTKTSQKCGKGQLYMLFK